MSAMAFREPNEVLWRGYRPGHKGTQVTKRNAAVNATQIVHTVTTNKTLFLCFASFHYDDTAVNGYGTMLVRDASDVVQYYIFDLNMRAVGQIMNSGSFNPPIEIPAGWDICVTSSLATGTASGFIFGWEE